MLEVADNRLGAGLAEVAGMVAIADQADRLVAALGQQLLEEHCDLSVPAGDRDLHAGSVSSSEKRSSRESEALPDSIRTSLARADIPKG